MEAMIYRTGVTNHNVITSIVCNAAILVFNRINFFCVILFVLFSFVLYIYKELFLKIFLVYYQYKM